MKEKGRVKGNCPLIVPHSHHMAELVTPTGRIPRIVAYFMGDEST